MRVASLAGTTRCTTSTRKFGPLHNEKLRRGPGSPFCLVEQGYGVCGARDERSHASQQQQLVDQLGHDVLPRSGSGKTTTWSRNFGSATACGPLDFIALMRGDHGEPQAPSTGLSWFEGTTRDRADRHAKDELINNENPASRLRRPLRPKYRPIMRLNMLGRF